MPETISISLGTRVDEKPSHDRSYHFKPLKQDDRIRGVFGVPEDAPIPPVTEENLTVYHDYLIANLAFPFDALVCQHSGESEHLVGYVKIIGLVDPRSRRNHVLQGLFAKAENHKRVMVKPLSEIGVREDNPNCRLIDDYSYWFVNWL